MATEGGVAIFEHIFDHKNILDRNPEFFHQQPSHTFRFSFRFIILVGYTQYRCEICNQQNWSTT
jgi:hypothetical protein